MSEWQPIETAPRDETKIIVFYSGKATIGWFDGDSLYLEWSRDEYGPRPVANGRIHGRLATHWMPLPEPPK